MLATVVREKRSGEVDKEAEGKMCKGDSYSTNEGFVKASIVEAIFNHSTIGRNEKEKTMKNRRHDEHVWLYI